MDTTKVLNIFVSVARARNFSQAALDMGLTPPVVSRAIAQLEEHLGIRLFHRTTRRVNMTDECTRLFELANAGLSMLNEAMDKIVYAKQQLGGSIRVVAPRSLGSALVVPLIAAFQEKHPEVEFDVALDEHFTDLVEQKMDVGFRAGVEPEGSLIVRALHPMDLSICASRGYLSRHGFPGSAEDLQKHVTDILSQVNMRMLIAGNVYKDVRAVSNPAETQHCL